MEDPEELITVKVAAKEIETAIMRLALLHLSFSKTLIEEFGEVKGKELVIKSILEYGKRITYMMKKGYHDLPKWGINTGKSYQDDQGRFIVTGCNLAKIFKEYKELDLGCLYCYVDAAKSMASDPMRKLIHLTSEACGDDKCTFEYVDTTPEERHYFDKKDINWNKIDPRLYTEINK